MTHSLRALLFFLVVAVGAGCARRAVPLEPLALRASAYHVGTSIPAGPPIPAQLPTRQAAVVPSPPVLPSPAEVTRDVYEQAYQELVKMLDGRYPISFKRAVFLTENAYLDNQLSYEAFNKQISALSQVCRLLKTANDPYLLYDQADKENVARNAAIFRFMSDTTRMSNRLFLMPYRYDFEDFNGDADWSKMFVSKLLIDHSGNCHSLPFLYKILADETGAPTWLSLAPNHVYLKQHNRKDGWYNTELTSHTFPMDAWLTASGYISRQTIISGLYMDTLTARQNVVLCLVDLAKGYERRAGAAASEAFVLKCTGLALQHFPHYINAQLLEAETLRKQFERQTTTASSQQAYATMEAAYTRIFDTGYREMPAQMYAEWLKSVMTEKSKYQRQR